jgi:hypothetical protein
MSRRESKSDCITVLSALRREIGHLDVDEVLVTLRRECRVSGAPSSHIPRHRFGTIGCPQLSENVLNVRFDGYFRDEQRLADGHIGGS